MFPRITLVLALGLLASRLAIADMPLGRLYLGAANAQAQDGGGQAGLLGYQSFTKRGETTATFWAVEIAGVKAGQGALPFLTGDLGLRWAPFPDAFLRPYARINLGLTLIVIIPVPSVALGVGVGVPLGSEITLDLFAGARQMANLFDNTRNFSLGIVEIGLGF